MRLQYTAHILMEVQCSATIATVNVHNSVNTALLDFEAHLQIYGRYIYKRYSREMHLLKSLTNFNLNG